MEESQVRKEQPDQAQTSLQSVREQEQAIQEEAAQKELVENETEVQSIEENKQEKTSRDFSVTYRIGEEELYRFQTWISREQLAKGRKRAKIMAIIELFFGIAYLISMIVTPDSGKTAQYLLSALLIGMGVYGLLFQKYWFDRNLRKAIGRQYTSNPYFKEDISVDFYPNKFVERFQGSKQDNNWEDILGIFFAEWAFIVQLEPKRCMLIPTAQMDEKTIKKVKEYLHTVSETYEKPEETI